MREVDELSNHRRLRDQLWAANVSLAQAEMNMAALEIWIDKLLQHRADDLLRYKGILHVKKSKQKVGSSCTVSWPVQWFDSTFPAPSTCSLFFKVFTEFSPFQAASVGGRRR